MKLPLLLSVLPILAVGQSTSQQSFANLCGSGQATGTKTFNGEQYTYYCNHRATDSDLSGLTSGHDDPATCAARTAGAPASVGVTWLQDGRCALATAGPPYPDNGYIFFEKVVASGGGFPSTCCQERDDCRTKLQACETARDQFKSERDTCQAGASGPAPGTGGPSAGGGRVSDCK